LFSVKILMVKLGAIGDIVHTLPALAAIRRAHPDAEISWAADTRSSEILRGNEMIDPLIEIDTKSLRGGKVIEDMLIDLTAQVRNIRKHNFDIDLDFQGLMKSALLAKLSGAKRRWGFDKRSLREPAGRFLLTDSVGIPAKTHVIKKNLLLAKAALNVPFPESYEFPIDTEPEHRNEAAEIRENAGGRFAILNPAGGWVTKLWRAEDYGRLADLVWERHGLIPVVTSAPSEKVLAARVLANSRSGKAIAAQPSLKGFYELAKHAEIYVGGDTGPTHLAVAAGAPVVGIFGPTEWWRNGSPDPLDIEVGRSDIECRVDCHRRTCSEWVCMDIGPETVLRAVSRRLALRETAVERSF
jgi:lipopolysaccharide heptosyltransferase I